MRIDFYLKVCLLSGWTEWLLLFWWAKTLLLFRWNIGAAATALGLGKGLRLGLSRNKGLLLFLREGSLWVAGLYRGWCGEGRRVGVRVWASWYWLLETGGWLLLEAGGLLETGTGYWVFIVCGGRALKCWVGSVLEGIWGLECSRALKVVIVGWRWVGSEGGRWGRNWTRT